MRFKTAATPGAPSSRTTSPLRTLLIAFAIVTLAQPIFAIALRADGVAVEAARAASSPNTPYSLEAQALLGRGRTDLYLTAASSTLPRPNALDKVQVKRFSPDGTHLATQNFFDVPLHDGIAQIPLDGPARHDRLEVLAHAKAPDGAPIEPSQNNIDAGAVVLRRPDLAVALTVPSRIARRFTATATIRELGTDTGATASLALFDGAKPATSVPLQVTVAAGGTTTTPVTVRLRSAGTHTLRAVVADAAPAEAELDNNDASRSESVWMYTADGAVSSQHGLATAAGIEMLKAGGNAVDAAAAMQWVLNVTQSHLNGLGGGVTALVHLASGADFAIDARETAPAATTPDMYVGAPPGLGTSGASVGVPGTLAGVDLMLRRWGTRSLAETLKAGTRLAREGFPAGVALARACRQALTRRPGLQAICRKADGSPIAVGDQVVQPDLAKTFDLIASQGPSALYAGPVAQAIVDAVGQFAPQGRISLTDLANYSVDVRAPIFRDYRGVRVVTVPPSSAGGLVLLQALGLVERFPLGDRAAGWGFGDVKAMNVMMEAIRLALADRAKWMGDDRFSAVPKEGLLSPAYIAARSALINENARISPVVPGDPLAFQPTAPAVDFTNDLDDLETTHFSVVDKWGNAVAFTTTLQGTWGSGIVVPGYGFVLNNSLVNFNLTPKKDVASGNPGANDPAPGKRPMGNTAPVMLFADGEPVVISGTPGGIFIPQVMFEVIVNLVDHHMTLDDAVKAPRFWLGAPEAQIDFNAGFPDASLTQLRAIGQKMGAQLGGINVGFAESVGVDPETVDLAGVPDMRGEDSAAQVLAP